LGLEHGSSGRTLAKQAQGQVQPPLPPKKDKKHFFFLVLLGVKPKASHLLPSIYQLHLSLQQSNFLFK
jgi:hypothetical protein